MSKIREYVRKLGSPLVQYIILIFLIILLITILLEEKKEEIIEKEVKIPISSQQKLDILNNIANQISSSSSLNNKIIEITLKGLQKQNKSTSSILTEEQKLEILNNLGK